MRGWRALDSSGLNMVEPAISVVLHSFRQSSTCDESWGRTPVLRPTSTSAGGGFWRTRADLEVCPTISAALAILGKYPALRSQRAVSALMRTLASLTESSRA